MYVDFSRKLEKVQRSIVKIDLSPRYAWQVQLDNGMVLELGREQVKERLARFVGVYPYTLASMSHKINYVDLRYRNGFAVNEVSNVGAKTKVKTGNGLNSAGRV